MIGTTLSHYRITAKLGEGGMGEVYRAHDERLDRDVAIKVLPEAVAKDPDRLSRFEREARLLASLNHQNIATLYGLEEHDGQRFLVMELAEGETLAERIKKGPIPVDDALPIALQIAEGLEAAHEQGIIHRDLKPANVMTTPHGVTKVLDFGIAKPFRTATADQTHTRTITRPPTRAGVLMGTPTYMSPEQVRGQQVDKRSDIWAFGVVLWEILTGARLFEGDTDSDILLAVMQVSPSWQDLPPKTPRPVTRLLRRCLERDPRKRLHDIADARLEIEEAIAQPESASAEQMERPDPTFLDKVWAARSMLLAAAAVGALLATTVWWLSEVRPAAPRHPVRLALTLPPAATMGATIEGGAQPQLAISPDGRWLVFAAKEGDAWRLFKRSLEQFDAAPIPETEGGFHPFFSPDSLWVGFFAGGKLKKVPLAGGAPQVLADAPNPWGATWGTDGTIVFNPHEAEGLWRVPAIGGTPEKLVSPDYEQGDRYLNWPEFLPDGRAVLFMNFRGFTADDARIEVLDLESRARKTLIEKASYARYVPTGHLIFAHEGAIQIAPFDVGRREVTGPSVPLPDPILYEMENGVPHLTFSAGGTLAFIPGSGFQARRLVSVDLAGRERPLIDTPRGYMYPKFSPDGERLAVTISEPGDTNVWVLNLATGAQAKLTHVGANAFPFWTPDGERVNYLSDRGGNETSIDWIRADGHGESESLVSPEEIGEGVLPGPWSPDGEMMVYSRFLPSRLKNNLDIWIATRDRQREPRPFLATGANEYGAVISPDGRWLAYVSGEIGRSEIYVVPFPDGGERHQISTDGGRCPVWLPDGRIIYYRSEEEGQTLAVPVTTNPRFRAGAPHVLLEGQFETGNYNWYPNFDIAPDGKSFVMIKADEAWGKATEIRVILNWFEELERLVPTK